MDYIMKESGKKMLEAVLGYRKSRSAIIESQNNKLVRDAQPGQQVPKHSNPVTYEALEEDKNAQNAALSAIREAAEEAAERYRANMGELPTPEQAAALQVLAMRKSISQEEYEAARANMNGNFAAAKALDEIAAKNGLQVPYGSEDESNLANIMFAKSFAEAAVYNAEQFESYSDSAIASSLNLRLQGLSDIGTKLSR